MAVRATVKPIPMHNPSSADASTVERDANDSARPSTAQLTTIRAINNPSTR